MFRPARRLVPLIGAVFLLTPIAARGAESAAPASQDPSKIIAVGVVLEPSAEMARFAKSANKGVRRDYSAGFTLGANQAPHIALVQLFIRAGDLPKLEAKLTALLDANNPRNIQLSAIGYGHSGWDGLALMHIAIQRSVALGGLQAKIAEAVEPFAVPEGSADGFAVNSELPKIDERSVNDVNRSITSASGKNFKPHMDIGLAHQFIAKDIEAIRFPRRTFRPADVAIYHLGNFGSAQKKLWSWKSDPLKP